MLGVERASSKLILSNKREGVKMKRLPAWMSLDSSLVANRDLVCSVCKGRIEKNSPYVASGLLTGGNSIFVPAHVECASLRSASLASRSRP